MRSRHHSATTLSRRRDGERGATLAEFALVLPVLLMLIIGLAEYGLAFKDWLSVSNSAREGARVASTMGNAVNADCEAIKAATATLVGSSLTALDRYEIFKADSSGSQILSKTNTYVYISGDPMDCVNWASIVTWPSADRNVTVGSTPLDILGFRAVFDHRWVTDFAMFSGTARFDEVTITRLEPKAFE